MSTDELRAKEVVAMDDLSTLRNWGRWGSADERGSLNLVTPEAVLRGITKVRKGKVYALGSHIRENRVPLLAGRPAPMHFMGLDGGDWAVGAGGDRHSQLAEDYLVIGTHGTSTHIDGLCHTWSEHKMYNGFSGDFVRSYGALRLGIENVEGLVTRGVLVDIAGYLGVDVLDADHLITADEVLGCLEAEDVGPLESGDAVLIRTGWSTVFAQDEARYSAMQPGVGPSAALMFARSEVCLVGCDNSAVNGFSGFNPRYPELQPAPDWREGLTDLHIPLLRNLGIYLLEMLDLEVLGAAKVHEFLLCIAPLLIKGGTGSPVNPLAVV
jgi:kynurenine formamidase